MSEVHGRTSLAHRCLRSHHAHAHASRLTPYCPPRRALPRPRACAHAPALVLSISILRFLAAHSAPTPHNPHSSLHAGRRRTPQALTAFILAMAAAACDTRAPSRPDQHIISTHLQLASTLQLLSSAPVALQSHRIPRTPLTSTHSHCHAPARQAHAPHSRHCITLASSLCFPSACTTTSLHHVVLRCDSCLALASSGYAQLQLENVRARSPVSGTSTVASMVLECCDWPPLYELHESLHEQRVLQTWQVADNSRFCPQTMRCSLLSEHHADVRGVCQTMHLIDARRATSRMKSIDKQAEGSCCNVYVAAWPAQFSVRETASDSIELRISYHAAWRCCSPRHLDRLGYPG